MFVGYQTYEEKVIPVIAFRGIYKEPTSCHSRISLYMLGSFNRQSIISGISV